MIETAKRVLKIEAEAVMALADRLDGNFSQAVEMILACQGRVVITGMGKSGLICQKIAATMASTGTPALFLHPAEGIHGDLGMLMKGDIVIAVSNSGTTEEIVRILPVIKRMGLPLIAMTGNGESHPGARPATSFSISPSGKKPARWGLLPLPARRRRWLWGMRWRWLCSSGAGSRRRISPFSIPAVPLAAGCSCGSRT